MGGKAFTTAHGNEAALNVPRMETDLYFESKAKYVEILKGIFRLVDCPVEAPGKDSYGDIDIVVADPDEVVISSIWNNLPPEKRIESKLPKDTEIRKDVLIHVLEAKRALGGGNVQSFAVPHPVIAGAFIQVDVSLQPVEFHAWHVFHQSYGDLWNVIGTSIRAFGVTVSEHGFYIRDPDIEKLDRRRGRVLLSTDPRAILDSLGLDYDEWQRGWSTEPEMFQYAASCKFFRPWLYTKKTEMKAGDRKRLIQRPCFQRFVDEFVPDYLMQHGNAEEPGEYEERDGENDGAGSSSYIRINRQRVIDEMLAQFGARERFDENHRTWVEEREALRVKREAKAQRREEAEAAKKSYAQHWIEWFLSTLDDKSRRELKLDMDKGDGEVREICA